MRQKTLLKIIGLMRKGLGKGLTILEISKQLKIGYRPAYNHITEMEKEGIIEIEKIGSSKQCKLNLASPQTRHLLESLDLTRKKEIYQQNPKLKTVIESLISKLTEKFISEVHSIVLFGSYAKNTERKESDIDIYIETTNPKIKEEAQKIYDLISVKIGKFNVNDLLIKEIMKNHAIIKGGENYYEKVKFFE